MTGKDELDMPGSQTIDSSHDRPQTSEQRPNVVYILLDDVGFAHLGCYGSEIDTPAIDSLAETGLRFNNFHTTALCSPTRAALLTGRNHHTTGVGMVCEFQNGGPGYQGVVSKATGTVAEAFRAHGYGTFAVGKWHLAPVEQTSYAGPFDQWPLARGFDRYYGFLGASTDQYHPDLTRGNDRILPPDRPGYHLSEDLVDQAIDYVRDLKTADPDKPFFMYLAFGAVHAPLHAPSAYIEKYAGRFDEGWDILRQRTLERQIESGIVPPDTDLAPRNEGIVPWEELDTDERQLFCRMQEVLAGFVDHTDAQIGRLLEYLDASGLRDNTIVVLLSDNGASQEGGLIGRSELLYFADGDCTVEDLLPTMDGMGSEFHHSHYPQGW
jgi:arylsulfatase A-like enzyme